MRAFAQTYKIFDREQTASQPENHIDGDKASQLKPGEGGTVYSKPQCLAYDHVCIRGRVIWKAAMQKIYDGQKRAGDAH